MLETMLTGRYDTPVTQFASDVEYAKYATYPLVKSAVALRAIAEVFFIFESKNSNV